MYVRLLREILVSMDTSNSDIRRELIIECCKRYANDSLELTYVDELDVEYTAERAIWWYTRPTFMYRMLNQALFTQDVDIMYKMRFFIKDLHQQLEALHSDYIKTLSSKCITVYRGVSLPDDTFEQIQQNIDGLISFNTFLSTSTERRVALAFASQKLKQPGIQSVLFNMMIDIEQCRSPFADIQQLSEVKGEKEILFSMGTMFRIHNIEKLSNGIWEVKLVLNAVDDIQLHQLTEHMRAELQGPQPLFTLGRLMKTLGQYDKAKYFYRILMNEVMSNPADIAQLYSDLGTISMDERLYSEAFKYFQKSIMDHPDTAQCYSNLGLAYGELGQYEKAHEHLHHALELDRNTNPSLQNCATRFNNLGTVYYKQKHFDEAKQHYEQALKLRMQCLPATHDHIAQSYSNIGAVLYVKGDYTGAYDSFIKAFEIKSTSLPSQHPSMAITINNIARVLVGQGLYEKAIPYAVQAVDISRKALTNNHPQTQEFINSLQSIRRKLTSLKNK
ncbi:unnamed protein product [Rotaria sp. Silwood1]|nr:unnamed protein product [Rotaria sp. Silwood1]